MTSVPWETVVLSKPACPAQDASAVRYLGSKTSTLPSIAKIVLPLVSGGTFCDCFGGVGTVGSFFKRRGFEVHSGDLLLFAHYFQVAQLQISRRPAFEGLERVLGGDGRRIPEYLNSLIRGPGWFTREYSERRKFFTVENARKIDSCWRELNKWWRDGLVDEQEFAVLKASLVNSADRVANTAGTYYAYLKTWHRKARQPFHFTWLSPVPGRPGRASLVDAVDLVQRQPWDVLYLDPPYNERCYSGYYHLPETLAGTLTMTVSGKSGMPSRPRPQSKFNKRRLAETALADLLGAACFRLLLLHYSDQGLILPDRLRSLLTKYGRVSEYLIPATGYSTRSQRRIVSHRIYAVAA